MTVLDKILGDFDDVIADIEELSLEKKSSSPKSGRKIRKLVISDLDVPFWERIRLEIIKMLIYNYNHIRIMNTPTYQEWKKKAIENGRSVKVEDSLKKSVIYAFPSLRTGHLRQQMQNIEMSYRNLDPDDMSADFLFTLDLSDLINNYGEKFRELVKERKDYDPFLLTEEQTNQIMRMLEDKLEND